MTVATLAMTKNPTMKTLMKVTISMDTSMVLRIARSCFASSTVQLVCIQGVLWSFWCRCLLLGRVVRPCTRERPIVVLCSALCLRYAPQAVARGVLGVGMMRADRKRRELQVLCFYAKGPLASMSCLEEEAGERTEEGGGLMFLEVCSRRIQAIMYAFLTF